MRRVVILLALAMAACSKPVANREMKMIELNDQPPPTVAQGAMPPASAKPQIAYSYKITYSFDQSDIAAVQQKHVALCTKLGIARCRVIKTDINGASDGIFGSSLNLLIDAQLAADFQRQLDDVATQAGGTIYGRHMTAEDVSKELIDSDARVRAKQALADRLLRLIQTSNGKVGELVEAERAFATAQEELDGARNWQAQLNQRVAMSELDIEYGAGAMTSVWSPVGESLRDGGRTFTSSVGITISFTLAAIPWFALLAIIIWVLRKIGWVRRLRLPLRRRDRVEALRP